MTDAEEEAVERIAQLEKIDRMLRQLLRHHEELQRLQAQAQVDPLEEAENLKIVRMFEEAGYVKLR